ncbi:MAG: HNH endonuclease family protein [Corynebacterium sp.]|nr:HNH endonuclease family protein [Corynebacterium sp.]
MTVTTAAENTDAPPVTEAAQQALDQLDSLEVKGRAPKTAYSRDAFGQRWSDDVEVELGHNGCDTRNDILRTQLTNVILKPGTRDCVVLSGTLVSPYSGNTVEFQRGNDTSPLVQIDHVVALADAWQSGAFQWDDDTRRNFANDPRNLRAVEGRFNQQKGASNAASWVPPTNRCQYAIDQVSVKAAYHLWVTAPEKKALIRYLEECS